MTYSEFYDAIFKVFPEYKDLQGFDTWKDEINEEYAASCLISEIAKKMIEDFATGREESTDFILGLVESIFTNFPDSSLSAILGTDFTPSILEYSPNEKILRAICRKMGKETLLAINLNLRGYSTFEGISEL